MEKPYKVFVLRIGHRPERDKRITTHVGLVARAFGADGFVLAPPDENVVNSVKKVLEAWGGKDFYVGVTSSPRSYVKNWKKQGGAIVHLTMYGVGVDDIIDEIRRDPRDKLVVVGAEKVPKFYFEAADYNVAIGHQPHSEVSALAVFLDRLYEGKELNLSFNNAKIVVEPSLRGKKVVTRKE